MPPTDTSERRLEDLIVLAMTGCDLRAGRAQTVAHTADIAPKVAADSAYQNAQQNTPHTARMAHDQALSKVMQSLLKEDAQVYKQFVENDSFKRFVSDMVFHLTNRRDDPAVSPDS